VTVFTAHKYFLAAASPVFSTQFFGSLQEEGGVITLTDVTARAFKAMLEFVYGHSVTMLEQSSVRELFEALRVADKYMIEKMKETVQDRLNKFPITRDNVGEVTRAALLFRCFHTASSNLLQRLEQPIAIISSFAQEVFEIAEQFEYVELMETVLVLSAENLSDDWFYMHPRKLDFFWFCFQTGNRISCNQAMPETLRSAAKSLVDACVYEFQRKESQSMILMSVVNSGPEREKSLFELMKLVKNSFCTNCTTSPCQDGKRLKFKGDVKEGCKVKEINGLQRAGIVVEGTFKKYEDFPEDMFDENYFNANTPHGKYYKLKITEDIVFACEWSLYYDCK